MEEEIVNNNDNKQENMEISEETIQVVEQSKLDISEIASFKDIIEFSTSTNLLFETSSKIIFSASNFVNA